MLIEMITPKIKEFEGNFSQSKRPSQDDVNHLDSKLNKIMQSVIILRVKFESKSQEGLQTLPYGVSNIISCVF